jgi:Carboxypeptidase regulatory-like domain/TonB dependent receptor
MPCRIGAMSRRTLPLTSLLVTACAVPALAISAVALTGQVRNHAGEPVHDAVVTVSGAGMQVDVRTDARGRFSLDGIPPGRYGILVRAPGFRSARLDAIAFDPGAHLSLDAVLSIGRADESSGADGLTLQDIRVSVEFALREPMLSGLPLERNEAIAVLPDYVPGIADQSALGAGAATSTRRTIDGIDVSDPLDGTPWMSYIATSADIVAIRETGFPAADGGFTGASVDVVSRSATNRLSGYLDGLFTTDALGGTNVSDEAIDANPLLADPDRLTQAVDSSAAVGGPLVRDRVFYTVTGGYFSRTIEPSGARSSQRDTTPRAQGRLAIVADSQQHIGANVLFEDRSVRGAALAESARILDDAVASRVDGASFASRFSWQRALGSRLRVRAGYSFVTGSRDRRPNVLEPGRFDETTGQFVNSEGTLQESKRQRHLADFGVSAGVDAWGAHLVQAGAEIERSHVDEHSAFVDGRFFLDLGSRPAFVVEWEGSDQRGRVGRESFYVQDTWKAARRVTLNLGVRTDLLRGDAAGVGTMYQSTVVQPRLGARVDLTGTGQSSLWAHFGTYADALFFSHYRRAAPGVTPVVTYAILPNGPLREVERLESPRYRVQDDIAHPRVDELSVGLDHAFSSSLSIAVSGVFRETREIVDSVFPDATWIPITLNGLPGERVTGYRWANRVASQNTPVITNVDGFVYSGPDGASLGTAASSRRYRGLITSVRYIDTRGRWTLLGGYAYARADGSSDNTLGSSVGDSRQFESPSVALNGADGLLTHTREHEVTVLITGRLPWIAVHAGAVYIAQSGARYAAYRQFSAETLDYPQSELGRRVLLEPRGSRRLPFDHLLDLRFEYRIGVGGVRRVGIYADVRNVLNRATTIAVQNRFPLATVGGAGVVAFDTPVAVRAPRQVYVGARLLF